MRRARAPILLIPSVAAILLVVGGLAVWRGETPPAVPQTSFIDPDEPQPRSLTAEEESYEAAMWPLHREVIEASAGTMTLAGIVYVTEGRDIGRLVATVTPLERRFHEARLKARAIAPPPSLAPASMVKLVTEEKAIDWHDRSQAEMRKLVWSQPSVKYSFYKNKFGEVYGLSPWRLVDYWAWTREPQRDDLRLVLGVDVRDLVAPGVPHVALVRRETARRRSDRRYR